MTEIREYPKMKDIYGSLVFDQREMKQRLPRDVFDSLIAAMEGRQKLDSSIADTVALAMKDWAVSKGADHWAHWFHPLTELTAEKHTAFLMADENGNPLNSFRGKDLMQSEPDASSFPSGGTRSTFEARGYSAWDPTSPAFIIKSKKGGTLCIPSIFIAYDGSPLDMKTYLLRAMQAIETRSMKMLKLFGNRGVRYVHATVGGEQEFFLLDRPRAQKRPRPPARAEAPRHPLLRTHARRLAAAARPEDGGPLLRRDSDARPLLHGGRAARPRAPRRRPRDAPQRKREMPV